MSNESDISEPDGLATVEKGAFRARLAQDAADLHAAQALRGARFLGGEAADADDLDDACLHVLVERVSDGRLAATFRFLHLLNGSNIDLTYSSRYYDLNSLRTYPEPILELGRFCVSDDMQHPDVLRIAWAFLTRYVDAHEIGLMFGCSSFPGNDTEPFADALALLGQKHLAPPRWRPRIKAPRTVPFARTLAGFRPSLKRAMGSLPPLLRTYLTMGGWVSDHAVIDPHLGTFHVFTGVEIRAIPKARVRLLRADAA